MRRVTESISSATYSLHAQRLVPGAVFGNPHYHGHVGIGEAHAIKVKALEQQAIINARGRSGQDEKPSSILQRLSSEIIDKVYAGMECPLIDGQEAIELCERKLIKPLFIGQGKLSYLL